MNRRGMIFRGLVLSLCLAGGSACSLSYNATSLGVPARLSSSAEEPPQGERFKVSGRAVWGLWGLVRLSQPNLERALAHQLIDARELADITIRSKTKFPDVLFTVITLGLISTRSVEVEGVAVQ